MKMKIYIAYDRDGPRHYGIGILAISFARADVEALKENMDGQWDGCEGDYNIKVIEKEIGVIDYILHHPWAFCLHEWPEGEGVRVWRCKKCGKAFHTDHDKLPKSYGKWVWNGKGLLEVKAKKKLS